MGLYVQSPFNEWDRHGTCSGQTPRAYFGTVRKARAAVKIPPDYADVQQQLSVTPRDVEEAFISANPGLSPGAIAIGCARKRLTEVRLCLSKDDCPSGHQAQLPTRPTRHATDARRVARPTLQRCPLLRVKRTSGGSTSMSAFDPKQTRLSKGRG